MVNKIMTLEQAVADVRDGMTIMVGGFLATGSPEILMDALVEKGVKHLTVIANDGGLDAGQPAGNFAGKTATFGASHGGSSDRLSYRGQSEDQ